MYCPYEIKLLFLIYHWTNMVFFKPCTHVMFHQENHCFPGRNYTCTSVQSISSKENMPLLRERSFRYQPGRFPLWEKLSQSKCLCIPILVLSGDCPVSGVGWGHYIAGPVSYLLIRNWSKGVKAPTHSPDLSLREAHGVFPHCSTLPRVQEEWSNIAHHTFFRTVSSWSGEGMESTGGGGGCFLTVCVLPLLEIFLEVDIFSSRNKCQFVVLIKWTF